jgi:cytidylate kinase
MNNKFAITIARQYGSGGLLIGKKVAELLGVAFYDKELLEIASQKSGLEEEFLSSTDEISLSYKGNFQGLILNAFNSDYSLSDDMFKIQSDIIKVLARKNSSVFVGRCADYVLRNNKNILSVFICADKKNKAERISTAKNIGIDKAFDEFEKVDKQRAKYYNLYTGKVWGNPNSYHLCVNTSVISPQAAAEFIADIANKNFLNKAKGF